MTTRTAEPNTEPKNTLATELINEHEANRWWHTTERIELTPEQANELRAGVAEGRCAWGIAEQQAGGRVRWMVLQELCGDASREGIREGHVLRYNLVHPPIPTKNPNHAATSVSTGYAQWTVQSQARYHLTATLTTYKQKNKSYPITVKLESWVVTLDQKDKVLKHWTTLKAINIQEEVLREPTEDEANEDAYYQLTGKRLKRY